MPQAPIFSPLDFVRSFLAAAKHQGVTACVVFAYQENNALKMSMSSNADAPRTRVALEWVCDKVLNKPIPQPPPPDTPPTLPS